MNSLRLAIGTDHGGFDAKNDVLETLREKGYPVIDCGTYSSDAADYPIFAGRVAELVSQGAVDFGILICRSGIGMSMVANRFHGVRAGLVTSPDTARLSREHNNANVIVMGSDHMSYSFMELLDIFLSTKFESGGRHERRVNLMNDLDSDLPAEQLPKDHIRNQVRAWVEEFKSTQNN